MRSALAAAVVVLAAVAAGSATGATPQRASVRVTQCDRVDHAAVFHGRMRRMPRTRRMAMRFALLERMPGQSFQRIDAPGLERWHSSRPGKAVFSYRQAVKGLAETGAYRALLAFRWYDRKGRLLREERRRSGICDQRGPRPNLRARVIEARPGANSGGTRYAVRVSNRGALPAAAIEVRLSVDGAAARSATIPALEPGASADVTVGGPNCRGAVAVVVDPADAVEESNEADNAHSATCAELAG